MSLALQVGPSLLTASLADVLKVPDSLPAINASYYLPLNLPRAVPQAETEQRGEGDVQTTVKAVHEPPQTGKKKQQQFPNLQQTGIGIRSKDFKAVRDQLNKKLAWSRKATHLLTKAFLVVEIDGPTHPTMQLLPPVAQVATSCSLTHFSSWPWRVL